MTARDRLAVRLGLVVIAAATTLRIVPWAALRISDLRERAMRRTETLAQARAVVAGTSAAQDSLRSELRVLATLAPKLLQGRSQSEAGASLAGTVSAIAGSSRIRILQLEPVPDSGAGVFRTATVYLTGEGDVAGLTDLLARLESGDPLLNIGDLSVQALDPASPASRPERLRIAAAISGWYLPRLDP